MNKDNIAPLTEAQALSAGWKKMPDLLSLYHFRETAPEALTVIGLKVALGKTIEMSVGSQAYEIIRPFVERNLDTALGINHKYVDPTGHYEATYLPDGTLLNKGNMQGTYNVDPPDNLMDHFCSAIVNHWMVQDQNLEYDPTRKCFVVSEDKRKLPVDCDTGEPEVVSSDNPGKDALHSLADLLETGEELVEVRQDMREDRRERKDREKTECERKAAEEEERLRQQQLEEQRRNKDEKKSDKKDDKKNDKKDDKKDRKKDEDDKKKDKVEKDNVEKKDKEPKADNKPKSQPSAPSIDFSKLNNLISQQVSLLRGILSSGKKATSAQHAKFNSLNTQYVNEFNRLKAQIGKISDSTKRSQYLSRLASINSRMNSEVDPLLAQGERRGLFKNY